MRVRAWTPSALGKGGGTSNAIRLLVLIVLTSLSSAAITEDEISLFDSSGKPRAYIAEELTIYLWSGKPVAYLHSDAGKLHVYGFNGRHLGWFVRGIIRDHGGNPVGGVKEVFTSSVEFDPFRSFKQFKPFKAFREFAPFQPFLTANWSEIPLQLFLMQGAPN
jgi:hypothetical protein